MKFLFWNISGIWSKLSDFDFCNYIQSFDIIGMTETWCKDFKTDNVFQDYEIINKDADNLSKHGRLSGGISVLVKKVMFKHVKWTKIAENAIFLLFDKQVFGKENDLIIIIIIRVLIPRTNPHARHMLNAAKLQEW